MRGSIEGLIVNPLKVLSIVMALSITGPTATARPVPGDGPHQRYPVNQVLRSETDHCGHKALLRRGYFNRTTGSGFGFDKMYHKHNLKQTGAFAFIVRNPDCGRLQGGTTQKYDAYAHRIECGLLGCQVTDIRHVWLSVDRRALYPSEISSEDRRANRTISGQKGVITAFCEGEIRCPTWVDHAINLPAARGRDEHVTWSYKPLSKDHKYRPGEVPGLPEAARVGRG
jgi:hypothetical protein